MIARLLFNAPWRPRVKENVLIVYTFYSVSQYAYDIPEIHLISKLTIICLEFSLKRIFKKAFLHDATF